MTAAPTDLAPPLTDPAAPAPVVRRPHRRRRRRIALIAVLVAVPMVLAAAMGAVAWRVQATLDAKIDRFADPFAQISPTDRVAAIPSSGTGSARPVNLLVFGSDSRISAGDPSQWAAGAQRTDAIMLVHVPADRAHVYVTSIPRDSWVNVPGHGMAKINAAFSWGGPALAIRTVEQLTKVRIDHLVLTDFSGFARITDLLGGVDVAVAKTTTGNTHGQGENLTAGPHHLDGATALSYVCQRYTLPGGDFDRVKRQQNWIRAVLRGAASSPAAADPQHVYTLLDAVATSVSTDSGFTIDEMRDLALSLRSLGPGRVRFMTAPVAGTGWSPDGAQSIVLLDAKRASALWNATRADDVERWLDVSKYSTLAETVR